MRRFKLGLFVPLAHRRLSLNQVRVQQAAIRHAREIAPQFWTVAEIVKFWGCTELPPACVRRGAGAVGE